MTARLRRLSVCLGMAGAMAVPGHVAPSGAADATAGIGAVLWHAGERAWGTPAADAEAVYFLTPVHEVQARDIESGALRWQADTGEPGGTTAGSAVVLAGDEVIAGDYNLVAFDRRDGALRWRFTPGDGYAPGMYLGGVAGDLVFAGSPAGRLYAVDRRSGQARWSHHVDDAGAQTTVFAPVADDEIVAAGYTTFSTPQRGGVVVLDAASGRLRWSIAFPRPAAAMPDSGWSGGLAIAGEVVLAVSSEGLVFAFDRQTGSLRWTLPAWTPRSTDVEAPAVTRLPRDRDYRPLARAGPLLFVASLSGEVIAYDLADRGERWRYKSPRHGSIAFRLLAAEESLYVPYIDGALVALDTQTGAERWRTPDHLAGVIWPPAVSRGRVFVSDFDAGAFAFER